MIPAHARAKVNPPVILVLGCSFILSVDTRRVRVSYTNRVEYPATAWTLLVCYSHNVILRQASWRFSCWYAKLKHVQEHNSPVNVALTESSEVRCSAMRTPGKPALK